MFSPAVSLLLGIVVWFSSTTVSAQDNILDEIEAEAKQPPAVTQPASETPAEPAEGDEAETSEAQATGDEADATGEEPSDGEEAGSETSDDAACPRHNREIENRLNDHPTSAKDPKHSSNRLAADLRAATNGHNHREPENLAPAPTSGVKHP